MSKPDLAAREKFQELLRELFQIRDAAELDFGIYRIMGQKRAVIEKFIDRELIGEIDAALAAAPLRQESHAAAQLAELAEKIRENIGDDAIDADGNLGSAYEKTKLGKDYLAVQKRATGAKSGSEQEATIYNHLHQFFSRYYDKGDFLSLRRYSKREKYAIPYNGEEVHLHWANADQYYIKTGETFTDYRWKDPSGAVRVRFTVTRADVPKDNIKSPDTRLFLPRLDELAVESVGAGPKDPERHVLLTLPFHYRGLTETEANHLEAIAEEKGLTGGNGSGGKLQAAALAEAVEAFGVRRLDAALGGTGSTPRGGRLKGSASQPDGKPASESGTVPENESGVEPPHSTLLASLLAEHHRDAEGEPVSRLAHHLRRFTVKNTSDYFIHKDLGGFLTRELDFYLKNEVLHLDTLEAGGEERAEGWFETLRAMRRIGGTIIRFLAQIENFQKRIFEKKKFVTECHWCLTLDRVPEALYPEIAKNAAQIAEWKKLFAIEEAKGWTEPPTAKFLKENWNLVLDTRFFGEGFVDSLTDLNESALDWNGLLIRSENSQALRLAEEGFRETSKCVYIDPPYNTSSSAILYKNDYRHSSWATFMRDRIELLRRLLKPDGAIFVSIDKVERQTLEMVLDSAFGTDNHIEELIWTQNTANSQLPNYSTNHEYVEVYAKDRTSAEADADMFRSMKPGCSEVLELVGELNPKYPSIEEIESAITSLYQTYIQEFKEEIEAEGLEWNKETEKLDPWKGIFPYTRAEYRSLDGRFVQESEAAKSNARIWVWSEISLSAPAAKQAASTKDKNHSNYRYYRPIHPVTRKECDHPRGGWKCPFLPDPKKPNRRSFTSLNDDFRIAWGPTEKKVPRIKGFLHEVETNIGTSVFYDYNDGEAQLSSMFGTSGLFLSPKNSRFPGRFIDQATRKTDIVIDCFGGSGSTAHGVLNLNRFDRGDRRYFLIELGDHFESLLKPRILKAIHSEAWSDGKPSGRVGISQCVKYVSLESYEDALGNIAFDHNEIAQRQLRFDEYVIHYMLAFETGGSETLLDTDRLVAPFDYKLEIRDGDETVVKPVDLPETFNFLLGLRVRTRRVLHREVKRGQKKESLRYLVLRGRTNPHATGGEREVVVIWRTTAGWEQADYQADRAFIEEHGLCEGADEVFVNDQSLLRHPGARSLDPVFKRRMFNEE